jgi:hypothetical protein
MAIAIALDKQSHLQKTQKKVWAIHGLAIPFFVFNDTSADVLGNAYVLMRSRQTRNFRQSAERVVLLNPRCRN